MKNLEDLEKILSDVREIGATYQKELEKLREENEAMKDELKELRDENNVLRSENEKIYIEMNNLRAAKEDLRVANEAFTTNLNQLVTRLAENHEKNLSQINQLLNDGLQKFIVDYASKIRSTASTATKSSSPTVVKNFQDGQMVDKFPDATTEVIVEDTVILTTGKQSKPKMKYADFYAEEIPPETEGNAPIKLKAIAKPRK